MWRFIIFCYLVVACQSKEKSLSNRMSMLDSAIIANVKSKLSDPDSYEYISTVREKTVYQLDWLSEENKAIQLEADAYTGARDFVNSSKQLKLISANLSKADSIMKSPNPRPIRRYEYLHTFRAKSSSGSKVEQRFLIHTDTLDNVLFVKPL